jgi:F-type H+-transporting ATPase subunit b
VLQSLLNTLSDPKVHEAIAQIVTQIIAFLVFLWVLKKFAWGRLLQLLDERKQKISSEFDRIKALEEKFVGLEHEYNEKIKNIDVEARRIIQDAIADGRRMAQQIADKARQDARQITDKAQQNIELEVAKARLQLKQDIIKMTLLATEKIIKERLDEAKHRELISSFIDTIEKN